MITDAFIKIFRNGFLNFFAGSFASAKDLKPNIQTGLNQLVLAGEAGAFTPLVIPANYQLWAPFNATTQTFTAGPQLNYRHFKKVTLFVHPSIGAIHEYIAIGTHKDAFVTNLVLGDTKDQNSGKGRFALYGADATGADATYGKLATMYDGIRPAKNGYVPMLKQGSIILGTGGDNSCSAGGRFYEGAMTSGPVATQATLDALQAAIVAAKYGK